MDIIILPSILFILFLYMILGTIHATIEAQEEEEEEKRIAEEERSFKAINGECSFKFKASTTDRERILLKTV